MGNPHWGLGTCLVFICTFLVTVSQICVGGGNLTSSCSEQERLALLKFKHNIGDIGMLSSWGDGNDCCRWERVGCDATGRVVSLRLRANLMPNYMYVTSVENHYLIGDTLNSCLAELVNRQRLDLSGNFFNYAKIPKFLGSFKQLRYLSLSGAGFIANIPHQIGNLSNLKVLGLGYLYDLTIDDMAWISGLSKLEHLDLSDVDLSRTRNLDNLFHNSFLIEAKFVRL